LETQLQQERAPLEDARSVLQRERSAREEARYRLHQLREAEIEQLTGELVEGGVAVEALRTVGAKKDASVLQLQQEAEATCTGLEKERKQVEGELQPWPFVC
jgi:hypothetical protein